MYPTPKSLVWELVEQRGELLASDDILEPACGQDLSIVKALDEKGFKNTTYFDLNYGEKRQDMFEYDKQHDILLTNVPFTDWDRYVLRAKTMAKRVILIGRLNYFGTYKRDGLGVWKGLREMNRFNRMVDYETPCRDDGLFHVGGLVTAWFVWDKGYIGKATIDRIDINKYAKLGQYPREQCENCGMPTTKKVVGCKLCK